MSKIIDVSAYQGAIDWKQAAQEIKGVILRATTQNGKIDTRFMENLNGALQNGVESISAYKFAYTRTYIAAYMEACKTLDMLDSYGALRWLDMFYLDLEAWGGRDYTTGEANEVIRGYKDAAQDFNIKFGLYFNYNYARNIVDDYWKCLPLWIARYNSSLGDVTPWTPKLWQYTDKGTIAGIKGNVDISKEVEQCT